MPCEKYGPSEQNPRPKVEVFVVTEARGLSNDKNLHIRLANMIMAVAMMELELRR